MAPLGPGKPGMSSKYWRLYGVPGGIRTPVTAVKGLLRHFGQVCPAL